jgi:acyl-CoA reductase-like NAD-dependent aldehyde dehydrogenase
VLKPASQTPLSALLLAELETEAGLPPGWLNVVAGSSAEIGDVLIEDERVKALTFTGSGRVGWKLAERAPRKRVKLELGNSTPVIVEADADLEQAAAKVAANGFSFAGQSCISVQRVYVQRNAYAHFIAHLVPKVEDLRLGDPADEETDVGPVIDDDARDRILEWVRESGAEILTGGDATEDGLIRPTIVAGAPAEARVNREEVFGPVVSVTAYDSLGEAIELANSTKYGLQAGIFTARIASAMRAAQELEFGGVTVNEAPTFRADQMPYGGVKASGNTREGPAYAVREFTEERLVVLQL